MSSGASVVLERPEESRLRSRSSDLLNALTRAALGRLLTRLIRTGSLIVVLPSGEALQAGDGTTEPVQIRLRDNRTAWRLALYPGLGLGEAWMDGDVVLEKGTLWDLLDLVGRNLSLRPPPRRGRLARLWRRVEQANDRSAARRNVAHHYDLSLELYRRFLDADLQ